MAKRSKLATAASYRSDSSIALSSSSGRSRSSASWSRCVRRSQSALRISDSVVSMPPNMISAAFETKLLPRARPAPPTCGSTAEAERREGLARVRGRLAAERGLGHPLRERLVPAEHRAGVDASSPSACITVRTASGPAQLALRRSAARTTRPAPRRSPRRAREVLAHPLAPERPRERRRGGAVCSGRSVVSMFAPSTARTDIRGSSTVKSSGSRRHREARARGSSPPTRRAPASHVDRAPQPPCSLRCDAMATVSSHVDTQAEEFARRRARMEALVAELRERTALVARGGSDSRGRAPPRPREADRARADRPARRPGHGVPRARRARGLGALRRRGAVGRDRHRDRRRRGAAVRRSSRTTRP